MADKNEVSFEAEVLGVKQLDNGDLRVQFTVREPYKREWKKLSDWQHGIVAASMMLIAEEPKGPAKWGGARPGAGRKAISEDEVSDDALQAPGANEFIVPEA